MDDLKDYADRPKYQRLIIDFEIGEDPDDAYSKIPYEKGSNLLLHLGMGFYPLMRKFKLIFLLYEERVLGGLDVFLPYVRDYVESFMGKSINTEIWKDHLYSYWKKHDESKIKALDSVDWNVSIISFVVSKFINIVSKGMVLWGGHYFTSRNGI